MMPRKKQAQASLLKVSAHKYASENSGSHPGQSTAQRPMRKRGMFSAAGHGSLRPGEKPKDLKGSLLKLSRFIAQFKWSLLVVVLFAFGSTVFNILGPKILSTATTELFEGVTSKISGTGAINFDLIAQILVTTLVLYLISAFCSFVQGWLMSSISQKTCYRLRKSLSEKVDRMPTGYFEHASIGDTLSRITNDVDTLGQTLNQGVAQLIISVTTVVGVIIMMLSINPLMTLVALLVLPLSALLMKVVVKRSQKHFVAQQNILGEINGLVEETFSGHIVVKAFNREKDTNEHFNEVNERLREAAWKSQFMSGLMQPLMNFVGNLGYVVVALMGTLFAIQRIITVGDIQAFIQYMNNLTQPIKQLAQVANVLQQMAASAERIFAFLEEPEEEPESNTVSVEDLCLKVDFDHVRFGYDAEKPVIKDFSAHISEGQTVALVGPTGTGKTTIVKLLMRFYDVQAGAIRIGDVDIRSIARSDVRGLFGMVLQDTWLFHGTIRENIRYGRLDATDEEVEEAARAAFAHRFIQTLPDGYDTLIAEDAGNISQGQRQLLTIARAFLANRRMIILDEATSSVDTRTEERIQKAMDNLMKGRTSFVIAHRLSTIKGADLILVVNDGDIVEQGSHEELLTLGGFYSDLYNSQFVNCIDEQV